MNSKFLKIGFVLLSLSLSLNIKCETIQVEIFFDKNWNICKSEKAFYFRLCGWNTTDQFFEGEFSDYLLNGTKIVQGKYEQGKKNGEFIFYYESGSEKIKGTFKDDRPDSLWSWYYPNNKNELKIFFNQDEFDIIDVNDDEGNSVLNEMYNFSYKFQNDDSNSNFSIMGTIDNKLKEGKWKIMNNMDELGFDLYKNGQHIKTVYGNNTTGSVVRVINNNLFVPYSIYACEKLEFDEYVSDTDYPIFSSRFSQWKPIETALGIIGDSVLFQIDVKPRYVGGIDGIHRTLRENLKLTLEYDNCKQFGYAYFELEIDENGDIIKKTILRSPDEIITEIALTSLNYIGRFKPAINEGKTIKSKFTSRMKFEEPITINLKQWRRQ